MPSECIQALSPGYSELHSPDSLYSKDSSDLLPEEIKLGSAKLMDLGINGINGGPLHNDQMQSEVPAHHTASLLDLMESFSDVPASTQMNNAHPAGMTLAQMMPSAAATMQIKQENMDAQTLLQQLESSLQNLNQENDLLVPNGAGSHRSPVASPDTTVFTTDNSLVYSVFEQENAVLPDAPHVDSTTQRSLIEQSEAMALESNISPCLKNSIDNSPFWALLRDNNEHIQDGEPKDGQPRKARKSSLESDAPSSTSPEPTNTNTVISNGFDINGAVSSSQFVFTKFGSDVPGIISLGMQSVKTVTSDVTSCRPMLATETVAEPTSKRVSIPSRRLKVPSLNMAFPTKSSSYELKIVVQPEEQHRARYMTEGSRGSIKDRSQDGHPVIKLLGYNQPATVQVYIGSDTGRVKPHGFYQACRVCGKNSTPCTEKDVDGTTVIEIALDPKEDMTVSVDCVGILKLRNADVEQRIGLARSKKKSTRARMVFRVNIPKPDGSYVTLQSSSTAIACTQPAGQPEVSRMSLSEVPATGGTDLFIIGKNFTKGSKVFIQEKKEDKVEWSAEAPVDQEYFQPTHLICALPPYRDTKVTEPVSVCVVVQCAGRPSDAVPFKYSPVAPPVKIESHVAMETDTPKSIQSGFNVSPVAVALNKWFEQTQNPSSITSVIPTLLIQSTTPNTQTVTPSSLPEQVATPNTMASSQNIVTGVQTGGALSQTAAVQSDALHIQSETSHINQAASVSIQQLMQQQVNVVNQEQTSVRPLTISQLLAQVTKPSQLQESTIQQLPPVVQTSSQQAVSHMDTGNNIVQLAANNAVNAVQLNPNNASMTELLPGNATLMQLSNTDNAATTTALLQLLQAQMPSATQVVNTNTVTINNVGQMVNPVQIANVGAGTTQMTSSPQIMSDGGNNPSQQTATNNNLTVSQLLQSVTGSGNAVSLFPVETLLNSPGMNQPK